MAGWMRRGGVALIALFTTAIPIVEIGLFGYETFLAQEAADDQRDESFQDLLAFQAQIDLHASQAALLEDEAARRDAADRIDLAIERWDTALGQWRSGDYDDMFATVETGRAELRDEPLVAPDGRPPWAEDDRTDSPAFPWLVVSASAVVALGAWMFFLIRRPVTRP